MREGIEQSIKNLETLNNALQVKIEAQNTKAVNLRSQIASVNQQIAALLALQNNADQACACFDEAEFNSAVV